jgi:nicotinamide phosphoribosyltransferase
MKLANIEQLLAPSESDKQYTQVEQLKISLICRMDSYKFSHPFAYRPGIKAMSSYGSARIKSDQITIPMGMQILVKRYLTESITMRDIDAAEAFSEGHFGRKLFARSAWEKVVTEYNGKLPLVIRMVPEGTKLPGGLPMYTVTCFDADLAWMSAGFETMIQRGIWYPTTIATNDYHIKRDIKRYYEITGADMGLLPFSYHDFGGRGVTCGEQAEIGGAAHTVSFMGSDTVEGILAANFYYKEPMAAYSVYATEHSIECSFGPTEDNAIEYIRTQLKQVKALGLPIVSIVLDGYDVYREAELCCTVLKQDIIDCGAKVVFRPDSGDMMEVVPRLLRMQEMAFGVTMTSKNYKKINTVGIIQGDGVDHMAINSLLGKVTAVLGYSADCVIFGSGGALLQKVNRDTLKFAQKACAILTDDGWVGIAKNPVTDSGKKSKEGVLTTVRSKMTGEFMTARLDQAPLNSEFEDIMQLVYYKGDLYNETTLVEIRARVDAE